MQVVLTLLEGANNSDNLLVRRDLLRVHAHGVLEGVLLANSVAEPALVGIIFLAQCFGNERASGRATAMTRMPSGIAAH